MHSGLWAGEFRKDVLLDVAWGAQDQRHFVTFPFIRTFFSGGHFAVAVFFVISGYVLSAGPLSTIHSGSYEKFGGNVGSALFRRWIRLFVPTLVTTFLWMTSWHAFGWCTIPFEAQETYTQELSRWYHNVKQFSFLFGRSGFVDWIYCGWLQLGKYGLELGAD